MAALSALTVVFATTASAQGDSVGAKIYETIPTNEGIVASTSLMWVVLGAALVIFMQAGFALVETGFCRAKHAAHVVSTNFAVFGLGFVAFFTVGFSLMFGGYSATIGTSPVIGVGAFDTAVGALHGFGDYKVIAWASDFFFMSGTGAYDVGVLAFFLYMVAFMDTVATIPTGSMAERWKWSSFCIWGLFCGAFYYPLFGAMTWGGGWLSQLGSLHGLGNGYVDFAGSGIVHAMGGMAALAGAMVLGPRIGKFGPNKEAHALPGHHLPMAMLGTFILLFGWFGFNAASTFSTSDTRFAVVAANTGIAAAFGAMTAMALAMLILKKPDPGMMVNGMLAGLVGITGPAAFVTPPIAALIGMSSAALMYWAVGFIEKRGIDDPVGAISVHGACGLWGVLCVGLFADGSYGQGWNGTGVVAGEGYASSTEYPTGIFYGGGFGQLASQLIGIFVLVTVMFGIAYGFFSLQNKLTKGGIRSKREDEIAGLDMAEMGVLAYPEFTLNTIELAEYADERKETAVPL